jgi:hypothetical protein
MALQRIDTAYGPNPVRFNGNIQPQANANVFLGNSSYQFATVYASTFSGTATNANLAVYVSGGSVRGTSGSFSSNLVAEATTVTGNVSTGSFVTRGGAGIAGVAIVGGNLVAAATTVSTSATTGALVVTGGAGITGNIFTSGWIVPTANTSQNLGSVTNWWNTFYGVSTQAKYADLAENYQADAAYEPGTVLEFGGTAEVTVAEDGTRRVAGVVSTNPAHLMNGGLTGENVVAIALQGRTPCRVRGKISKGDMLVSGGSGYARPDSSPQLGAVIGKALEDFEGLEGIIEVVVGRL